MEGEVAMTIAELFTAVAAAVPGFFTVIEAIITGLATGGILMLFALVFPIMGKARSWFRGFMGGRRRRR